MACPGARLYSFDSAPLAVVNHEDTHHFRLYREFMADPKGHFGS